MTSTSREARLVETFVTLADTLVDDYDVVDLLQLLVERCVTIFDAVDAGIVLTDDRGRLEVVASSDEDENLVEILQLPADRGPCVASFATGEVVSVADVEEAPREWSEFRTLARALGFRSAHSVPLRLRSTTIGSLNLFAAEPGVLDEQDALSARALADVSTIGILHERAISESDRTRRQLQRALDGRVVIEQAKGVIAHTRGVSVEEAFAVLRAHARSTSTALRVVAEAIVARRLTL